MKKFFTIFLLLFALFSMNGCYNNDYNNHYLTKPDLDKMSLVQLDGYAYKLESELLSLGVPDEIQAMIDSRRTYTTFINQDEAKLIDYIMYLQKLIETSKTLSPEERRQASKMYKPK